jgi:hypothetical protein
VIQTTGKGSDGLRVCLPLDGQLQQAGRSIDWTRPFGFRLALGFILRPWFDTDASTTLLLPKRPNARWALSGGRRGLAFDSQPKIPLNSMCIAGLV